MIDKALFGAPAGKRDQSSLEKLRAAVLDKNFHWFNRYRTVDGFSIYGGRADTPPPPSQSNRANMAREMQILDVMTANRDKVIWVAGPGQGRQGGRQQHAAVHPGPDQQAWADCRTARTCSWAARRPSRR